PVISLAQEINLLKSAIIYGDKVKLYSLTASLLLLQRQAVDFNIVQKIKLMELVAPFLEGIDARETENNLKLYKSLLYQKNKSKELIAYLKKGEKVLNGQWYNLADVIYRISEQSGFDEILKLIDAGIVEIHQFKKTKNSNAAIGFIAECIEAAAFSQRGVLKDLDNETTDEIVTEFVDSVASSISEIGSYPLFDLKTSDLIRTGIESNIIQVTEKASAKGKHVGLAAHLLNKLPSFDNLSLEEVVAIRNELATPLIRFRAAMMKFSDNIKTSYWDSDFYLDADSVFHRDVAPAILDIEECFKSNRLVGQIVRSVSDKPLAVATSSGIGLILSNFSHLPDAIARGLGISAAAAPIV